LPEIGRKESAILRVLGRQDNSLGAAAIARELISYGIELTERAVRYHLQALDTAGLKRIQHSAWIRFIPVRCLGSVNVVWIADALARGFDGILLVGCKSGDDYQCHFIRGSELMGTRGDNIREKLTALALEEERVRVEQLDISEFEKLPQIINEFAEEIEEIGMNPFKGF